MNNYLTQLLLITIIITAGGPAALPPPPTATVTQTVTPSEAPSPTQTAIPTATPYPPLQTEGPYLLFQRDEQTLVMMDADGMGRKYIEIPQNAYISRFENAFSPNGEWLIYFTGSTEEPYDLALNLFNLKNKSSIRIANLIASGYPENLEPLTELISFSEYDTDCANSLECKLRVIESGFRTGIYQFDWSPGSQEIAFAAQIDGPSSDLYIYNNVEENSIRRLTNEPENIGLMIDWAPNGEKILYSSTESNMNYSFYPLHIADTNLKSPQNPKIIDRGGLFWFGEGWIDENSYLLWDGGEGAPPHNFRYIDTDSQQINQVWRFVADHYVINFKQDEFFLLTYPQGFIDPQSEPEEGIYLVRFDGSYTKITDENYSPLAEGPGNTYFVLQIENDTDDTFFLLSIGTDGKIRGLGEKNKLLLPSQHFSR